MNIELMKLQKEIHAQEMMIKEIQKELTRLTHEFYPEVEFDRVITVDSEGILVSSLVGESEKLNDGLIRITKYANDGTLFETYEGV
jgi:adenine/guanine phosphoribosyltransferase-like PRPP-binding protein